MSIEAIRELETLASVCPELNMANYTEDDVRHLNDWAIEMSLLVEKFTAIQQAEAKTDEMDPLFVKGALSGIVDAQVRDLWPTKSATHPASGVPDGCVVVKRNVIESALQHVPYRGETWSALNSAMRPVQVTETELKVARDEFNNAIDFAIKEGIGAAVFLDAWRHGDTTEWPEFHGIIAQAEKETP